MRKPDGINAGMNAIIQSVLAPYADRIEKVGLFGSRATGKARDNSDIDLVIYGRLSAAEIDAIWTAFDDSALSVPVDVVLYNAEVYPPLRTHIDKVMLPLANAISR